MVTPHCPDGIDGHRTLGDKAGLAGKRDMGQDEDFRTGLSLSHTDFILHSGIDVAESCLKKNLGIRKPAFDHV